MTMKVDSTELRKVFVACGVASAKKWNAKKLQAKIKRLPTLKDKEIEDDETAGLFEDIKGSLDKGEIPEVYDNDNETKPAKGEGKKGKAKAGGKTGRQGRAGKNGAPGIIESIIEFLRTGTSGRPLTKDEVLKRLTKRFPDRSADAMKTTISIQIPSRIKSDRGIVVRKNENGYWIEGGGSSSKNGKAKKKKKKAVAAD